jgi:alkylation response protein AidB-like acyl-CoA dehydrogenase
LDLAVVADAMGYCAAPGPLLGHWLVTLALGLAGTAEQKERWLPRLASGDLIGSVAFSEQSDRWQPDQWTVPWAEGGITGKKTAVLYPRDADLFLVGLAGGKLALVEAAASGIHASELDGIDRTRRIGGLEFAETPGELVGDIGTAERIRDAGLILLAADSFGGAHRSIEFTVSYANERVQFGKPIGHFQSVKHQISDTASVVEPARQLMWYAAYAFDQDQDDAPRMAAIVKGHLADRYVEATRTMVMLHGGIGYTWEFHCHFWLKRAMFNRNYLGSPAIPRERAAALAGW